MTNKYKTPILNKYPIACRCCGIIQGKGTAQLERVNGKWSVICEDCAIYQRRCKNRWSSYR